MPRSFILPGMELRSLKRKAHKKLCRTYYKNDAERLLCDPAKSPMRVEAIRRWGWAAARHTLRTGWIDPHEPEGRVAAQASIVCTCASDAI